MRTLFNFIVKYPLLVLAFTLFGGLALIVHVDKLGIDASSRTIMLDNDPDLLFASEINSRYGGGEFLVVAFTPNEELLSSKNLETILRLTKQLEALEQVTSTLSIINVPLIQSPPLSLGDLADGIPTLKDVDKTLAKEEFLNSPIYKNNLVSSDFKTTAILINLVPSIAKDLESAKIQRELEHENIAQIREILSSYQSSGKLFLGGVNMIADDMITFVKHDIFFYGLSLFVLIFISLYLIFGQLRFVLIPLFIAFFTALATSGLYGIVGWEITVVSSNYICLQLIICISIVLHLVVRYRELLVKYPKVSQKKLVFATLYSKATPSFFAIVTTVVGFASLLFSNIKPIIYLGLMMSFGIIISLIFSFLLFGSIMALLKKRKPILKFEKSFALTKWCYELVLKKGVAIPLVVILSVIIGVVGSSKLAVENSFIDYFKKSTEIYKGMAVIDQQLGGTTPLDIVIDFKESLQDEGSQDDEFADEFADEGEQYWFTPQRTAIIGAVHQHLDSKKEIGSVQSLDTLLRVGNTLNGGNDLTSFELAVIYNELPQEFAQVLLAPYLSIPNNQARVTSRVIDSQEGLKRDEFLKSLQVELEQIIPSDVASFRISNLMVIYNNLLQTLFYSQIVTIGFVLLALFVMFWLIFGSFKVAIIAIVSNMIPMSLVFGFMGFADIRLDVMSITIAAISIGIGVDDTIHYLHRFKEELAHTHSYEEAIKNSHLSIGYAMYYTSFIIMLGFSVLLVSNFMPTIYFGLLTFLVMALVLFGSLILLPYFLLKFKPYLVVRA